MISLLNSPLKAFESVLEDFCVYAYIDNEHNIQRWKVKMAAEKLYDDMMKSICKDVVTAVHRMANTGDLSMDNASRQDSERIPKRLRKNSGQDGLGSTNPKPSEDSKKEIEMRLRTRVLTSHDAWGRIPAKDVLTTCKLCSKNMSATRFAAHLDKCLGIGNSRASHSR